MSASASPTAGEAIDCAVALMGRQGDFAGSWLHEKATADLRTWLRLQLGKTPEPRRAKIISAIMNTTIDDNLPNDKRAVYRMLEERISLGPNRGGHLMSFVTLVHELDHLLLDLDSPISNRFLRLVFKYLYPRSEVFRSESRSHNSEYMYFSLLKNGLPEPSLLYMVVLKENGLSPKAQALLLKVLQDARYEDGTVRIKIYDEEKRVLEADAQLETETLGALNRLLENDLGDLLALDRQSQIGYVNQSVREYKFEIIKELMGRATFYALMSASVYSFFH